MCVSLVFNDKLVNISTIRFSENNRQNGILFYVALPAGRGPVHYVMVLLVQSCKLLEPLLKCE